MYRFVCLAMFVSGAVGQIIKPGICDFTTIGGYVSNLNLTQMLGNWNQIARIGNPLEVGECTSLTLTGTYGTDGALTGVQASYLEVISKNQTYHNGTVLAVPQMGGLFYMNLTGFLQGYFVVQATDYTGYAVFYHCETLSVTNGTVNVTDTKEVLAWQYHRKAELSSSEQSSISGVVNVNPDLNGTNWMYVSHNKTACGAGVTLAVPYFLIILATLFMGKEFV